MAINDALATAASSQVAKVGREYAALKVEFDHLKDLISTNKALADMQADSLNTDLTSVDNRRKSDFNVTVD